MPIQTSCPPARWSRPNRPWRNCPRAASRPRRHQRCCRAATQRPRRKSPSRNQPHPMWRCWTRTTSSTSTSPPRSARAPLTVRATGTWSTPSPVTRRRFARTSRHAPLRCTSRTGSSRSRSRWRTSTSSATARRSPSRRRSSPATCWCAATWTTRRGVPFAIRPASSTSSVPVASRPAWDAARSRPSSQLPTRPST